MRGQEHSTRCSKILQKMRSEELGLGRPGQGRAGEIRLSGLSVSCVSQILCPGRPRQIFLKYPAALPFIGQSVNYCQTVRAAAASSDVSVCLSVSLEIHVHGVLGSLVCLGLVALKFCVHGVQGRKFEICCCFATWWQVW